MWTGKKYPWESEYEARRKRDPNFKGHKGYGKTNWRGIIIIVAIYTCFAILMKIDRDKKREAKEATILLESPAAEGNK